MNSIINTFAQFLAGNAIIKKYPFAVSIYGWFHIVIAVGNILLCILSPLSLPFDIGFGLALLALFFAGVFLVKVGKELLRITR
jgi:hypothetical protein